ncbi:MAG: hypothetical protein OQJ84_10745 [Xanthomonadales bacterium]|nr:hypothetical protein [Xanthomonadales bacterium]
MNTITDEDLVLLFYGEHDDPDLAAKVASDTELSARFEALCIELKLADTYHPPHRGSDYGAHVWQRISPRLAEDSGKTNGWAWLSALKQPRFSLAGALSLTLVTALAFMLGRNGVQQGVEQPAGPMNVPAVAMAGIEADRLLSHSVSGHLEQVNLVMTQFANSTEVDAREAEYATDMLVANRLYRQAAAAQGKHKLAAFLAELEPLLIEMAYEAQSGSPATRERMQKEVREGLLFRVRVMNAKLNKSEISV